MNLNEIGIFIAGLLAAGMFTVPQILYWKGIAVELEKRYTDLTEQLVIIFGELTYIGDGLWFCYGQFEILEGNRSIKCFSLSTSEDWNTASVFHFNPEVYTLKKAIQDAKDQLKEWELQKLQRNPEAN